jgi:hypothetical protein
MSVSQKTPLKEARKNLTFLVRKPSDPEGFLKGIIENGSESE